ncbi:cupin domain-containing protein [Microvirga terrae]
MVSFMHLISCARQTAPTPRGSKKYRCHYGYSHPVNSARSPRARNPLTGIVARWRWTSLRSAVPAMWVALASTIASPTWAHDGQSVTVVPKFDQVLPNILGKSLRVVEVAYTPGAAFPPHTHARSASIYAYVLSGDIDSKENDSETRIFKEGESWYELPGAVHSISRNASKTKPAKLLAVFVADSGKTKLTIPAQWDTRNSNNE